MGELIICWVETHWQVFKEVRVSCAGCCVKSRLAPGRLEPEKSKDCVVNNLHKCMKHIEDSRQQAIQGFPGGLVVKNPLVIAGNIDSILGPGRSHMPWIHRFYPWPGKIPHAMEQLSLHAAITEPVH